VRALAATIFGRATLILPSCDGPFTWIVWALAVVSHVDARLAFFLFADHYRLMSQAFFSAAVAATQRALTNSLILVRQFSRLENGPNKRLPWSSIAYQPSLTARKSDWHSLM
jgi:hypothetical protein